MNCKSSDTVLETFKEILQDVNDLCTDNEAGFKLLKTIKSTMSDRASTEKKISKFARGVSNNNLESNCR